MCILAHVLFSGTTFKELELYLFRFLHHPCLKRVLVKVSCPLLGFSAGVYKLIFAFIHKPHREVRIMENMEMTIHKWSDDLCMLTSDLQFIIMSVN